MRTFLIDLNSVREGNRVEVGREDELCPEPADLVAGETVRVVDEEEGLGHARVEAQTADEVVLRIDWSEWRKGQTSWLVRGVTPQLTHISASAEVEALMRGTSSVARQARVLLPSHHESNA